MEEPLQLLAGLAAEYLEKYGQLASALRDADPQLVPHQLKLRVELATDRFRSAQMSLLSTLATRPGNVSTEGHEALITLFRSFDEMRIAFQLLLESLPGNAAYKE